MALHIFFAYSAFCFTYFIAYSAYCHQQIELRLGLYAIVFLSIDYTRSCTIISDYMIRDYSTTKTRTIIRNYFIISQKTIISLFHYDYFTYLFRNILLRLLRLSMILCIIFIASYYMHNFI
jgi:hypothetical protein